MKISVIVPVYNGKDTICECLEALLGQDYPKDDYEVIVVDDGSLDDTVEVVEKHPVRLIELEQNYGRVIAREKGACAASYDNLLFVDARVIVAQNILAQIARINYQPLMAGEQGEDKYRSPFDTLFYLIRKRIYAPYYPQRNWGEELWISQDNFDKAPKGLTIFFCSRQFFLQSLPQTKGKTVNDDTRILKAMVGERKLLRHTDLKITYLQRTHWREVLRHIYERGPRFADYYLGGASRYYNLWQAGLFLFFAFFSLSLFFPPFFYYGLLALGFGLLCVGLILSENVKDLSIVLIYFPLVCVTFIAGIIKGKLFS